MVGSFFITERLSPSELNKIAELSKDELGRIIDGALSDASSKVEEAIQTQIDASLENMNKTHNEIMFLYNMLNDKHAELTGLATDLQKIAANVKSIQDGLAKKKAPEPVPVARPESVEEKVEIKEQKIPVVKKKENPDTEENHTGKILEMRKKGMQSVEIAKALGVGLGEVNLVLGLYKGDTDS